MSEENFTYSEWPFFSCSWVRRTFASEPYFEISSGRRPREISKGSQANFLLTNEQEKKKSQTLLGEIFFTKIETIILTDCFFKFSGYFRVIDQRKTKKYQKMIFFVHSQMFFSRVNRRKKKSRTFVGEIFFTKRETIILTECFFKFSWLSV